MTAQKHTGSCLCKTVTFEVTGEFESFFLCHCKWCRKDTGSAHAANLFSTAAQLKWLSGESEVRTFRYKSTNHVKSFCPHCGSALPSIQMEGALLAVPAGSLNSEVPIAPQGHIYYAYKAGWDNDLHKIPKYSFLPDENKT